MNNAGLESFGSISIDFDNIIKFVKLDPIHTDSSQNHAPTSERACSQTWA